MAVRKSAGKEAGKTDDKAGKSGAGETGRKQKSIKTWMPWLPFVTWIIGAAIVTCLLFIFYNPSPTISAAYFVIIALGFYILWRSRRKGYWQGKSKAEG